MVEYPLGKAHGPLAHDFVGFPRPPLPPLLLPVPRESWIVLDFFFSSFLPW